MSDIVERLASVKQRLHSAYDGIGHSHGRPYLYFIYPPEQERALRRLIEHELENTATLTFSHIDVQQLILQSTAGQEQRREALLQDSVRGTGAAESLLRLWGRRIADAIHQALQEQHSGRPVIVLTGLAALHPLGTPTQLMEVLAEHEARDSHSGRMIPIVVLVPGTRPPQASREYYFLGQERLRQQFYRGEDA